MISMSAMITIYNRINNAVLILYCSITQRPFLTTIREMERLPSEVVSHILEYVDPADVEAASFVCRSFFEASLHPRLVKRFFIGRKTRCNSATVYQSTFTQDNATLRLAIQGRERGDDLSWNNANANYPPGTEVKSLVITTDRWISPYLYVVILNDILSRFPAVEDLELKHINMHVGFLVDASLSNHLQNLVMLKLAFIEDLPNFLSGPTMNYLPQIKSLTLESEVHFNNPREKEEFTARKRSVLDIGEFRRICEDYWEILDEIDVMYSRLSEDNMHELCNWLHPNIQTIKLSRCAYIDDNAINILARTARPRVLEIDSFLSNSTTQLSGNGVAAIATRMTSVENFSFYINENIRLNDHLFATGFPGLHSLSMTSYGDHSSHCLVKLTKRKLCVENLCKIDGTDLLISLATGSPNLQELSLDLICQISDRDLHIIAERFPTLRVLKLNSCCELTDWSLVGYETNGWGHQEHRGNLGSGMTCGSEYVSPSNAGLSRSLDYGTGSTEDQSERILSDGVIRYSGDAVAGDSQCDDGAYDGLGGRDPSGYGATRGGGQRVRGVVDRSSGSMNSGAHRRRNRGGKHRGSHALPRSGGLSNILVSRWLESKIDDDRSDHSRPRQTAMVSPDGAVVDPDGGSRGPASWSGRQMGTINCDDVSDGSNTSPSCNGQSNRGRILSNESPSNSTCPEGIEADGSSLGLAHNTAELSRFTDGGTLVVQGPFADTRHDCSPCSEGRIADNSDVRSLAEGESAPQERDDSLRHQSANEGTLVLSSRESSLPHMDDDRDVVMRTESHTSDGSLVYVSTPLPPSSADEHYSSDFPRSPTASPRPCLRHLRQLVSLCLIGGCEVSDRALSEAIQFPLLTYLKLTHCDNLTDGGVGVITTNNPRLVTFILEFCRRITDESVKSVVSNVQGLERAKFENCGKLTGAGLKHLSASWNGDTPLKEIYIGGCPISRAEIEEFKKACPAVGFRDFDW